MLQNWYLNGRLQSGLELIKLFLCSTQLSMKFKMLISIKKYQEIQHLSGSDQPRMLFFLLIVGILSFMSRKNFMLS